MCGIAGILRFDGAPAEGDRVAAMTRLLAHRGPDGEGCHVEGPVGLGHRRLSIIDLEGGAQPLCNEDGTVWVTFNGEIYNYRELHERLEQRGHVFKTRSDTETLVHAWEEWGPGCLERLRGMFAFAIWDRRQQRLFLARDRFGMKPLVYAVGKNYFAFASEMQAFTALPDLSRTLDMEALDLYLQLQFIPSPYTAYREMRKLPQGHYLSVTPDGTHEEPTPYWSLTFAPEKNIDERQWVERLDAALEDSVRKHLRSDVPFGAFLSGGVDSSTVVAYMARVMDRPVKTFSIGFEDAEYDESRHAREVAEQLGTEHYPLVVQPEAFKILPELVRHYGEPFADSSAVPTYYVSKLAAEHVKMVLSGDGGDELFAGYPTYPRMLWAHRQPETAATRVRYRLGNIARKLGLRPPLPTTSETRARSTTYFDPEQRGRLWTSEYRPLIEHTRRWFEQEILGVRLDVVSESQYFDIRHYLCSDILAKVDVASMVHGLEVRVPLLDHPFVELAGRIPWQWKVRAADDFMGWNATTDAGRNPLEYMTGKYIFKRTAEQFFGWDFLNRKKWGFSMPIGSWFRGPLQAELKDRLLSPCAEWDGLFERSYVETLLEEHVGGESNEWRLWALLFLREWMEQQ